MRKLGLAVTLVSQSSILRFPLVFEKKEKVVFSCSSFEILKITPTPNANSLDPNHHISSEPSRCFR
jgi:hypothetical protein